MYNNFQKLLFLFQDLSVWKKFLFIDEWKNKTKNSWTEIKDKLKIQLSFKSSPIFNIFPFKFISIKIYNVAVNFSEYWEIFNFFFFNDIGTTSLLYKVKLFTPDTIPRHHVSHPTISQLPSRIRVKMPIRTLLNFVSQ